MRGNNVAAQVYKSNFEGYHSLEENKNPCNEDWCVALITKVHSLCTE